MDAVDEQMEVAQTMRLLGNQQQIMGDEIRRWQLDPEELLVRVEKFLRRQRWNGETNKYEAMIGVDPFANELGIQTILAYLTGALDPRSTTLSNFDIDDVNRLAKQARTAIRDIIILKYDTFQINPDYIPYIVYHCDGMVYGCLKRAFEGGERRSQAQSHHTIENIRRGNQEPNSGGEKKGWLFK
jgi:hypothetical protein